MYLRTSPSNSRYFLEIRFWTYEDPLMKHIQRIFLIMGLLYNCCIPSVSQAQVPPGEETFLFHLGYFLPSFDTKLSVNNDTLGAGDEVNVEDDLGIDANETIIRSDITWRMSPRNRLSLGYFAFNRTGEKVLNRQIQIGDEIYPVAATLNTSLKFTVVPIYYYFSFIKTADLEFAGGLGLQWSTIKFAVDGSLSLGGADPSREVAATADAPMPLLSLDLSYYTNPQWRLGGNLGVFAYKVGASNMNYQGNVATLALNTDYWFSTYVGAGLALNWFAFDVDVKSGRWNGTFNYQYWGPQIYLSAKF